ncbi:MAG: VanZ family protein [Chloroflexota bacterium]
METVPLFLPGMLVTAVLAVATAVPLGRRLGVHPAVAFLLVAGIGLVVSATLTPLADALEDGVASSGTCDMRRVGWAPLGMYLSPTGAALNLILFVPLGVALGLLPSGRRATRLIIAIGIASPFLVEGTQLIVRSLGRGCQAADVVDNVSGVVLGIILGRAIGTLASRRTDGTGPA